MIDQEYVKMIEQRVIDLEDKLTSMSSTKWKTHGLIKVMIDLIEKNILSGWSEEAIKNCFLICNISLKDCCEEGSLICVKWLLANGANVHAQDDLALRYASQKGHFEVVKLLLDAGADIHTDDDYALRWASRKGHFEVVRLLLANGANVHAQDDYALRYASQNNHLEVVELLKSHVW